MKKAIIFDLDGTMIESINLYREAHYKMFKKRNLNYDDFDFSKRIGSKTIELMGEFANYFKEKNGEISSAEEILKEQDELVFGKDGMFQERVKMRDGVKEFLEFLIKNKIRLALATTARKKTVKIVFDKFNLWDNFEIIVTAEDIIKSKPDPEIYNLVFQKLNENNLEKLNKEDCLIIEDAESGIRSALAANFDVVAIPDYLNKEKDYSFATYFIKDFNLEKLKEIVLK